MNEQPKLEAAWDVDVPAAGFAERVVTRIAALDALEAAARNSHVRLRLVEPASVPGVEGKRYRLLAVGVAAAAAVALSIGAPPRATERLVDGRSIANGGTAAINPEAGTNGAW